MKPHDYTNYHYSPKNPILFHNLTQSLLLPSKCWYSYHLSIPMYQKIHIPAYLAAVSAVSAKVIYSRNTAALSFRYYALSKTHLSSVLRQIYPVTPGSKYHWDASAIPENLHLQNQTAVQMNKPLYFQKNAHNKSLPFNTTPLCDKDSRSLNHVNKPFIRKTVQEHISFTQKHTNCQPILQQLSLLRSSFRFSP